jgi:putative flippase GtrA
MRRLHHKIRKIIFEFVDFFYPPFKKLMSLQMYRYAACGGGTTLLNIFIYFITYNYILKKQVLDLDFIAFTPHIAAFIIAFCITFPLGFYLSMYVVFKGSHLRRRIQLIRYFSVALVCIILNYVLIKFFVEKLKWYPTPSLIVTAAIVIFFSYISQRNFSFKRSNQYQHPGNPKTSNQLK